MRPHARVTVLFVIAAASVGAPPALATDVATSLEHRASHTISVSGGATNFDQFGELGYRLQLSGGTTYGVELELADVREGFVGGYAVESGSILRATAFGQTPLYNRRTLQLDLRIGVTGRALRTGDNNAPADRSYAVGVEFGPIASIDLGDRTTLRTGFLMPVSMEVDPTFDVESQGALQLLGVSYALSADWTLVADLEFGGVFGFGGDGNKLLARGAVGLHWTFDDGSRSAR